MTVEQVRRFLATRPFEPFVLHVADQRQFRIMHPDTALLSASGRTITVLNSEGEHEVIDMLLVTSLRPLPATAEQSDTET